MLSEVRALYRVAARVLLVDLSGVDRDFGGWQGDGFRRARVRLVLSVFRAKKVDRLGRGSGSSCAGSHPDGGKARLAHAEALQPVAHVVAHCSSSLMAFARAAASLRMFSPARISAVRP